LNITYRDGVVGFTEPFYCECSRFGGNWSQKVTARDVGGLRMSATLV